MTLRGTGRGGAVITMTIDYSSFIHERIALLGQRGNKVVKLLALYPPFVCYFTNNYLQSYNYDRDNMENTCDTMHQRNKELNIVTYRLHTASH